MGKVFIVLDEQEQLSLEMILVDKDEREALKFLKNHVAPKVKKKRPCSLRSPTPSAYGSETALDSARHQR